MTLKACASCDMGFRGTMCWTVVSTAYEMHIITVWLFNFYYVTFNMIVHMVVGDTGLMKQAGSRGEKKAGSQRCQEVMCDRCAGNRFRPIVVAT